MVTVRQPLDGLRIHGFFKFTVSSVNMTAESLSLLEISDLVLRGRDGSP